MFRWSLDRRTSETFLLAVLSTASVVCLRFPAEPTWLILSEFGVAAVLTLIALVRYSPTVSYSPMGKRTPMVGSGLVDSGLSLAIVVWPMVVALAGRMLGFPAAMEMTALSVFGLGAIAMSLGARRIQAMSLVASGFLVLFVTAVSDQSWAVMHAIGWMAICVWHLVANRWERLQVCQLENVRRDTVVRPFSVLIAVALCVGGGWAVKDRMGPSKLFTWGFMPTSGGSKWSDPGALHGVGDGDAAIAGKEHAESFGAVESDLFMESTESTLFDMFSDSIGEPIKQKIYERRQGMMSENVIQMHERASTSEKGGSSFTTERMPPKRHRHSDDVPERAAFQWSGPRGIRLAMHRYDDFDGVQWTASEFPILPKLLRQDVDGAAWFFDPSSLSRERDGMKAEVEFGSIKVLRLDSTRLPCPMMTVGLHIRGVDQPDFFGIQSDGSFFMPGRERVPPLTVVRVASHEIMEDEILQKIAIDDSQSKDPAAAYEDLKGIIERLRTEFTLDPEFVNDDPNPLAGFLKHRRGGKHLFATAAAMKAREIGLKSRLVSGFYVRPSSLDVGANHANVMPEDVHVWAEIQLSDGRWFEVEATPGYRQPIYQPSAWLMAKRFAAIHWMHGLAIGITTALAFWTRIIWVEWLLVVAWWCSRALRVRAQLRLALRIVEMRASMMKRRREVGMNQRDWLLMIAGKEEERLGTVRRLCDAADHAVFGRGDALDRASIAGVVGLLNMKSMKQAFASDRK